LDSQLETIFTEGTFPPSCISVRMTPIL